MVRYPHIAMITKTIDKGQDADGNFLFDKEERTVKCQIDLRGGLSNGVDYSGKCYLPKQSDLIGYDDTELIFEGKTFKIVLGTNYQKHTELWLD